MKVTSFADLVLRHLRPGCPGPGWSSLAARHAATGSPPLFEPRRDAAELLLRRPQLAPGNRQQLVHAERQPFLELQLPLELLAAQAERGAGARREVGLEVADVALQRVGRLGRRVGQVAEQVQVVHAREGARQVVLDEPEDAAQRLEADLGVDARAGPSRCRAPPGPGAAPGAAWTGRGGRARLPGRRGRSPASARLVARTSA